MLGKNFIQRKRNQKGVSLIELLVAMSVFILISGVVSGLLISGIRSQRHTLASRQLLDQTSFALEYMSRALRMALTEGEQSGGDCLNSDGTNYEVSNDGSNYSSSGTGIFLRFINHLEEDRCQRFYLDGTQLMHDKGDGNPFLPLTSGKLEVTNLNFVLAGDAFGDNLQPRVTVAFSVQDADKDWPAIKMQATVSQRNLDE